MRLRWSSLALARAAQIVDYIARDRPQAAIEWIDGLDDRVRSLGELPQQGHAVPEWSEPCLRQIVYGQHRIIYETRPGAVEILTIKHGRQRLGSPNEELRRG